MVGRPESLNGVPVPYDAEVSQLRSRLQPPGLHAWDACLALGHHPSREAFELLLWLTASPDWSYRRAAVEAIAAHRLGHTAASVLIARLADPSPYVARTACAAVARLRLHDARSILVDLLRSSEAATRTSALRALATLWQPSDFDLVFSIYQADPAKQVRNEAAWTLRANASRDNWRQLFQRWKGDQSPRHRVWACELAEQFGDQSFEAQLRELLADPDGHVRKSARCALEQLRNR